MANFAALAAGSGMSTAWSVRASAARSSSADPTYVSVQVADAPVERSTQYRLLDDSIGGNMQPAGAAGSMSSTYSPELASDRPWHASGSLYFLMMGYQADDNSARRGESLHMAGIRYRPTVDYRIADGIASRVTMKLWASQGYADSRLGNFVPPQSLSLYEAFVEARPLQYFSLQAGALNQARLDNEILIGDSSFPGVLERLNFGGDLLGVELRAEQAIPSSTTLSTNTVDSEPTPSFFIESLILSSKPVREFEGKLYVSHFRYNDLPSGVAQISQTRGNTVRNIGVNSSKFGYQFEGFVTGANGRLDLLHQVSLTSGAEFIKNTQAPESYDIGQSAFIGLEIRTPIDISIKPRVDWFVLESDAAPAYWLESFYGAQTNRTGWSAQLTAEFVKKKFSTTAHYMHYDPINANSYQASEQLYFIDFMARHDLF